MKPGKTALFDENGGFRPECLATGAKRPSLMAGRIRPGQNDGRFGAGDSDQGKLIVLLGRERPQVKGRRI